MAKIASTAKNRLAGGFSQFQLRKFGKIRNWISN